MIDTNYFRRRVKHYVSARDESVQMFDSKIIESLTKVNWYMPLVVFVPIISWLFYTAFTTYQYSLLDVIVYTSAGFFIWSLTEYIFHRFIFHHELPGKLGKRIHFLMHGVHHDYPNDSMRLVMPPVLSITLATLFYLLFKSVLSQHVLYLTFASFLIGYLLYDMLHYAFHHAKIGPNSILYNLKKNHLDHHFVNPGEDFGVSSSLWDYVFRSKK